MKIIKININGHLKLLNDKNINIINTKGIKNNNKISYIVDNISHNITIEQNKIILIIENNKFKNILEFIPNKKNKSYYLLKDNNIELYINVKTNIAKFDNNQLIIEYEILDSHELYEYKIEMR